MKVRDLINELEQYDEDLIVVFKSVNSLYSEYISGLMQMELKSLRGDDKEVVVLESDGQAGAV